MEIANKKFLIYGMGKSGVSAYNFICENGGTPYMYNDKKNDDICKFVHISKFSEIKNIQFDYAIISPGVQIVGNRNIGKLKKMGILLISEMELGYLFCKGKFIAVTGTNGKTTCVSLLNHIISKRYKTFLCGNIGTPVTSICSQTTEDSVIVCEVSSFMLELTSLNFAPDIAVITNITPDHLSRHKTFDNYIKIKKKITENQNKNQHLVVLAELESVETLANKLIVNQKNRYKTNLIGEFNQKNIAICEKVCQILEISKKEFNKSLKTFAPVKYRLQMLGKKKGVTYINDSKSTNTDSTLQAVKSIKKNIILLLGGSDKGNDFYDIFKEKNIKLAIIYGETANKLETDALFMGFNKTSKFESLKESLQYLERFVRHGDNVLFSPACASYDEFNNYVERGEFFNKYFEEL